jgi:hypothetical protein
MNRGRTENAYSKLNIIVKFKIAIKLLPPFPKGGLGWVNERNLESIIDRY